MAFLQKFISIIYYIGLVVFILLEVLAVIIRILSCIPIYFCFLFFKVLEIIAKIPIIGLVSLVIMHILKYIASAVGEILEVVSENMDKIANTGFEQLKELHFHSKFDIDNILINAEHEVRSKSRN